MTALKKPVAAILGVCALLFAGLFFASAAGAYPAGVAPIVSVSDTTPTCGETVTVSGSNYQPGETVTVTDNAGDSATATAGSDGTFSVSFTITCPNGTEPTSISATGSSSNGVDAVTISTTASTGGSSGSGGLSQTGVAVVGIGAVGVVLLVGGGLLLMAGRRRKVNV